MGVASGLIAPRADVHKDRHCCDSFCRLLSVLSLSASHTLLRSSAYTAHTHLFLFEVLKQYLSLFTAGSTVCLSFLQVSERAKSDHLAAIPYYTITDKCPEFKTLMNEELFRHKMNSKNQSSPCQCHITDITDYSIDSEH